MIQGGIEIISFCKFSGAGSGLKKTGQAKVKALTGSKLWLSALSTSVEKHQKGIIDYERRQHAGKPSSKALGILKVVELNGQSERLWFPERATV